MKALENYLHENIPLSKAMGIAVKQASKDKVILSAPFVNNINHKKTVFGGSLHAVATLACWSLLHLHLKEATIVITKSEVNYLSPVVEDFTAECTKPEEAIWGRFLTIFQSKGKARIRLAAHISRQGRVIVAYQGEFAAMLRR